MACAAFAAALTLAAAGCECSDDREGLTGQRNTTRGGGAALTDLDPNAAPPPPLPGTPYDGRRARADRRRRNRARTRGTGAPGIGAEEGPSTQERERALQEAIRQGFGDPTSCLSSETREALGDSFSLHVAVRVTPVGRVIDARVSGSGVPNDELACMQERALRIRLPGPIENAPRTVATSINWQVAQGRVTAAAPDPPTRTLPPGTNPAGSTLPAGGTVTERPGGFVAPTSTLPATNEAGGPNTLPAAGTETERPRGFVPPSSTLPAQQ